MCTSTQIIAEAPYSAMTHQATSGALRGAHVLGFRVVAVAPAVVSGPVVLTVVSPVSVGVGELVVVPLYL